MSACGYWHPTSEPCTVVTLGDIEMVSSGAGLYGLTAPIDGWANSGISSGGPVPWGIADGGILGDTWFQGRSLTIEGDIEAKSHEEFAEAVEQLGAILTHQRNGTLEVDETVHLGLVRQIEVTRTRPVQITALGPRHGIFTIQLEAASFVRTSVDQSEVVIPAAGVDLTNHGNHSAHLYLTLKGPITNPRVYWAGGRWRYNGTIASGQTVEVDMERRTVLDAETGESLRRNADGVWRSLPPGETTLYRLGEGSGSIVAAWRSSWA